MKMGAGLLLEIALNMWTHLNTATSLSVVSTSLSVV